jgi:4-aminobutyrate aminotransferase / (S)-3-amino-2-methylpropionate transaminase / 5-aminovalerate transaminase
MPLGEGSSEPDLRTAVPGPKSLALSQVLSATECPAFDARRTQREAASSANQAPIVFESAKGVNVIDVDGNRFVDLTAGFGALILGHCPTELNAALAEQDAQLGLALGDVYGSAVKAQALTAIAALLPGPTRVMLGSSGADAVTAALKTAMLWSGRPGVLAFQGGYHGLTHGPLAACGLAPAFREPFAASLNRHVHFAQFPASDAELDVALSAVRAQFRDPVSKPGCILVEPILGRGGCIVPPPSFLPALRSIATENDCLLAVDEVWTGLGRSGALLQSALVSPDLVCIGKGLGAGVPVSACIGTSDAMEAWGSRGGTAIHTATHFGAPRACRAALTTLAIVAREQLAERAAALGAALLLRLTRAGLRVTGQGLMLGVHLADGNAALRVTSKLLQRGYIVLTGGMRGEVVTLTPPLTIPEVLLDGFAEVLLETLREEAA